MWKKYIDQVLSFFWNWRSKDELFRLLLTILLKDVADFYLTIDGMQADVSTNLTELGLYPDSIEGLDDIFKSMTDPIEGIETCHLQEKFSMKHLVSL